MANDLPPWGVDTEIPDDWFRPRWWFWAGIAGLVVGWVIGLNVKPDVDDLHRAALDLVPATAEVVEESVMEPFWEFFNLVRPRVSLDTTSESSHDQLAEEMRAHAQASGWRLVRVDERPGATVQYFETLLLRARASVSRHPDSEDDLRIAVRGRENIGMIVTATLSLAVGVLAAVVIAVLTRAKPGRDRLPFKPIRWWHVVRVVFTGLFFWLALGFVV